MPQGRQTNCTQVVRHDCTINWDNKISSPEYITVDPCSQAQVKATHLAQINSISMREQNCVAGIWCTSIQEQRVQYDNLWVMVQRKQTWWTCRLSCFVSMYEYRRLPNSPSLFQSIATLLGLTDKQLALPHSPLQMCRLVQVEEMPTWRRFLMAKVGNKRGSTAPGHQVRSWHDRRSPAWWLFRLLCRDFRLTSHNYLTWLD